MSSYFPSFTYNKLNSLKDKNLIVVAFDADEGEVDTFLGMDPIYTESAFGTKRLDYGAKYNSVAVIRISVIKMNGKDFTVAEVRDFLKWTTGARTNSYLDLVANDEVKFSYLGRVTSAYQQKMDARIVGLTIEFTSVSPWAYSPEQHESYTLNQSINIDNDGVIYKVGDSTTLNIDESGALYNNSLISVTADGVAYIDNTSILPIDNKTDDLYTPIYLNTTITNITNSSISIKNTTLDEETTIDNMSQNETITLSAEQFIISSVPNKIFGNTFNFIWPRLAPGVNEFVISGDGNGSVEFIYRYPIKLGDVAIDLDTIMSICGDNTPSEDNSTSSDNTSAGNNNSSNNNQNSNISGTISWSNITNTPTTLSGYGIQDAYTISEVDAKVSNVEIDEEELNNTLTDILGE